MKKKKETPKKAVKEKAKSKKALPCDPLSKTLTTGNFFDGWGKDPKHLENAVVISKDNLNNQLIIVYDISKYRGEGKFPDEEKDAFVLLLEVNESGEYGTCIISGQFLSPALQEIWDKRKELKFPFCCILKKKKAWGLYSP